MRRFIFGIAVGSSAMMATAAMGIGCDGGSGAVVDVRDASAEDAAADAFGGGGGSVPPGSSPSHGGDAGDGGSGGALRGECRSEADCPGGSCVELVEGGFHACLYPLPPPEECTGGGGGPFEDECCGTCPSGGVCSLHQACGGIYFEPYNRCVADECQDDLACGKGGLCLPAPPGGVRRCQPANECRTHSECTAQPDGRCAPTGIIAPASTCSGFTCTAHPPTPGRLICLYGSECASDADCPGAHCEIVSGRPACAPGQRQSCPPPP